MLNKYLQIAIDAYKSTSMDAEKRGQDIIEEYNRQLKEDIIFFTSNEEKEKYIKSYIAYFLKWLNAKSKCMSTFITGPANFPVAKNRKKLEMEHIACERFVTWRTRVIKKQTKPESTNIVKGTSLAIDKMQTKLDSLIILQENMKLINKIIRNKKLDEQEKINSLLKLRPTYSIELFKKSLNANGFASFQLTNNNSKIKRLKENIVEETTRLGNYQNGNKEYIINDISITENVLDNRLQLLFNEKPTTEIRTELKTNGFRWSPYMGVWQRQLTNNALFALKHLSFMK